MDRSHDNSRAVQKTYVHHLRPHQQRSHVRRPVVSTPCVLSHYQCRQPLRQTACVPSRTPTTASRLPELLLRAPALPVPQQVGITKYSFPRRSVRRRGVTFIQLARAVTVMTLRAAVFDACRGGGGVSCWSVVCSSPMSVGCSPCLASESRRI